MATEVSPWLPNSRN